ncbi:MAG: class I mannose-6-phosphate isomerase, partial [Synergistota bacterium]|nr:class I mannose-6-phosphate isomerase [Synergistota bacterium]
MSMFRLKPVFKDYLWGGERLKELFGKRTDVSPLAESWELAAHPDGDCTVADGPLAGAPLSEYLRRFPGALGSRVPEGDGLPVLIKLIDAREPLSVQVHPCDEYAARVEGGRGKTEMWCVLDRTPGAFLYCGFQRATELDEVRARIADGTLDQVLHRVYVEPGDVVFIPAGTVHAIGAGIVLAEIQQSSNTTYRMFDYGRRGPDGKQRPLHVERALDVATLGPADIEPPGREGPRTLPGGTIERLTSCPFFTVDLLALDGVASLALEDA